MNTNKIKIGIIDDTFPNLRSGFRIAEFNWFIENIEVAEVFTSCGGFEKLLNEYSQFYPQNKKYIHPIVDIKKNISIYNDFDLIYTVFLHNALNFQEYFKFLGKPFILFLYPSELIALNSSKTDKELRTVFNNPLFSKVIVSQKIWYNYLLNNQFVPSEKIDFIYGGVSNVPIYNGEKEKYKTTKNTFDICFTSHKYPNGIRTKGYDIFIDVCKKLSILDTDIRFHVVGGFTETDIDVSSLKGKINFYGVKTIDFLPKFYSKIDLIISPTSPSEAFNGITGDGFPTISCVDAAINGVLVFTTDTLNNNIYFKDNKDICIINSNVDEIVNKILYFKNNLNLLYDISLNCKESFKTIFELDNQMNQRLDVLINTLNSI